MGLGDRASLEKGSEMDDIFLDFAKAFDIVRPSSDFCISLDL